MKLRPILILCLVVVLAAVGQSTVISYLGVFSIKPDILLILVLFFGLYYGRRYGLAAGIICGIFSEGLCGIPAGALVFIYSLLGLSLGYLGSWIYAQRLLGQLGIAFICSLIMHSFLFFIFLARGASLSLSTVLPALILPACCYNAILAPAIFRFLKTLFEVS